MPVPHLDPMRLREVVLDAVHHEPADRQLALLNAIRRGEFEVSDHADGLVVTVADLRIAFDRSAIVTNDE